MPPSAAPRVVYQRDCRRADRATAPAAPTSSGGDAVRAVSIPAPPSAPSPAPLSPSCPPVVLRLRLLCDLINEVPDPVEVLWLSRLKLTRGASLVGAGHRLTVPPHARVVRVAAPRLGEEPRDNLICVEMV